MVEYPNHYCKVHFDKEEEYIASRQKWARANADKKRYHRYNTQARKRNEQKIEQYNFYRTKQWVNLRAQVLNRDYYLCQYCKAINKLTSAKIVDHIVPIEYDSKLKDKASNLATICNACHRAKTDWERAYYGTGAENQLKQAIEVFDINKIVLFISKTGASYKK